MTVTRTATLKHWPIALVLWCGTGAPGLASTTVTAASATHPDFSGVWGAFLIPGVNPFTGFGKPDLPLTAAGRARYDEYQKLVGPTQDSPGAHCLGSGMPEALVFSGGYPMEIIQRPEQITIVYEAHSEIRRLYFGPKVIPVADRLPARGGYSVARWEGEKLIVETSSLKDQVDSMYPHSDQARITEVYHVETGNNQAKTLVADWTLTDPVFYTAAITKQKKWTFAPKGILLPYECDEEAWLDHLDELRGKTPVDKSYK